MSDCWQSRIFASILDSLVDLVAIEKADGALATFPLTFINVFLFVSVPYHLASRLSSGRVSHAIDKVTGVCTLTVRPCIDTVAIPHIIDELTLEGALIVIVDDRTWTA